ncbi:MAG: methyltransferase domain-containing protein, partial [Chloroflexi bacterium]|nr:methyltransferase domain-containing protein [Chloroflexota bacterium]
PDRARRMRPQIGQLPDACLVRGAHTGSTRDQQEDRTRRYAMSSSVDRMGGSGKVVGVDLNPAMLAVARRLRPDIEWRQADAAALPFADGSFDAVLCQSALMFFPDVAQALREMARVVTAGGSVAVQVWGRLETQPGYGPFVDVAARHAGPEAVHLLGAYWVLGDRDALTALFEAAGPMEVQGHGGTKMRFQWRPWLGIFVAGGLSLALLSADAGPDAAATAASAVTKQTIQVTSLQDGYVIAGSKAKLQRRSGSLKVVVATRALEPGETVDVLWAVFNDPSACTNGNPVTGSPCGPADLFIDATGATLQFATRVTADANGRVAYEVSIAAGDTGGCIPGFPCRNGVTNPLGAEVHSAMFNAAGGRQAAQFVPPPKPSAK